MKTSRINSMTSSTFKNHRPINQVNDSAYQPGQQYRHEHQQQHESLKKEPNKAEQKQGSNQVVSLSSLDFVDAEPVIHLDGDLDSKLKKLDEMNRKKKYLQKYRSSI